MTRTTLAMILFTASLGAAAAADLQGEVLDIASGKGVPGVKVILFMGDKAVADAVTDGNGRYEFRDLAKGSYKLRFEPTGYNPNPDEIDKHRVEQERDMAPPCKLWPAMADKEAYRQGGAQLARDAQTGKGNVYAAFWKRLGPGEMAPVNKLFAIQGIQGADAAARDRFPPLGDYLEASEDAIRGVQKQFGAAVKGTAKMPTFGAIADFRLADAVLADIVVYELRHSKLTGEQMTGFIAEYGDKFGKSKSVGIVDQWFKYKGGRLP